MKRETLPQPTDKTPIDHRGNRAFENIREHQISSLFTLQKHLVDCNKGNREKNAAPAPLRSTTGEYSPCQTEMTMVQTDDGGWHYEYSELATQRQTTLQKGKAVADSYITAVTGKFKAPSLPIGAKTPAVKASAKAASGVIGAPTIGKPKDKPLANNPPIGGPFDCKTGF